MSNCNFKPLSDINYLTFFARMKPMVLVLVPVLLLLLLLADADADVDVGDASSSNCKHAKQAPRCGTLSF